MLNLIAAEIQGDGTSIYKDKDRNCPQELMSCQKAKPQPQSDPLQPGESCADTQALHENPNPTETGKGNSAKKIEVWGKSLRFWHCCLPRLSGGKGEEDGE